MDKSGKDFCSTFWCSLGEWIRPTKKPNVDKQKWKVIEFGVGSSYHDNSQVSKNYSYASKIHLGKMPMTRTQWRRHQRKKKVAYEAEELNKNVKSPTLIDDRVEKKPMKEIISPPLPPVVKPKGKD